MTPTTMLLVLAASLGAGYLGSRLDRRRERRAVDGLRDAVVTFAADHEDAIARIIESSVVTNARLNAIERRRELAARWEDN